MHKNMKQKATSKDSFGQGKCRSNSVRLEKRSLQKERLKYSTVDKPFSRGLGGLGRLQRASF